ncbi:cytochrome c [Lacipirellula parvula]|uniref:cytochrome c n=1 Tax=Lacipirellula parvula TaxID=2650471 RepID=UPI00156214B9|nr:cytochrome c [Lacipirellula parvula]
MAIALGEAGLAAEKARPVKRAKPPVWSQDVLDEFFADAREQLVGERPVKRTEAIAATSAAGQGSGNATAEGAGSNSDAATWSQLISGDTLAAEVKRLAATLRDPLANPAKFKSGGYKVCRGAFSELAVLFAVIAEYDGDVRWQDDAPALRDAFARAARNCKTGTDQTFAEGAELRTQLDDLVRGERLGGKPAPPPEQWSKIADRPLLMKRMESALQEGISPALANAREFSRKAVDVQQQAEVLAMLAAIIDREAYEYWDDENFQQQSNDLRAASRELTRAAADANYEAARAAAGRASQSCTACHEGYRG